MAFAKKNDIQIIETYIDRALSAKTDNRPDFQRMIKDSAKKKFDVILLWQTCIVFDYFVTISAFTRSQRFS